MREIEVRDVLTLSDGKKYAVISKIIDDNKVYWYIVNIEDYSLSKICIEEREGDVISLIELDEISEKLNLLFRKNMLMNIKELQESNE